MKSCLEIIRIIIYTLAAYLFPNLFFSNVLNIIKNNQENILFLSAFRRESELEKNLLKLNYGIFFLDYPFQKKVSGIFFGNHKEIYFNFIPKIKIMHLRIFFYKIFLKKFITFIKKKYNISKIFNFAIHYKSEFLFDQIAVTNDVKFITFHRECLYCSEAITKSITVNLKKILPFNGTKIIVHNKIVKDIFIKSKFCSGDKIEVIGPLRIDKISQHNKNLSKKRKGFKKKTVLFYIFGTGCLLNTKSSYFKEMSTDPKYGWYNLVENTFRIILENAEKFPKHEFIFKAKFASPELISLFKRMINNRNLKNVKFFTEDKNYFLLKKSDLVISFGSTTILEALMMNKSVLIPFFDEVKDSKYKKHIPFRELIKTNIGCSEKKIFNQNIRKFLNENKKFYLDKNQKKSLLFKYLSVSNELNSDKVSKIIRSI